MAEGVLLLVFSVTGMDPYHMPGNCRGIYWFMAVTNAGLFHVFHMSVALKLRRRMSLGIFEYRNKNKSGLLFCNSLRAATGVRWLAQFVN